MFVNTTTSTTSTRFPFQRSVTVLALTAALSACSVLKEDKIDYKSAVRTPTLEIPPDLSQLRRESRFAFESTSATAAGFQNASTRVVDAGTASNTLGKVKMERQGDQRWLVAAMPVDQVWRAWRELCTADGFAWTTD